MGSHIPAKNSLNRHTPREFNDWPSVIKMFKLSFASISQYLILFM